MLTVVYPQRQMHVAVKQIPLEAQLIPYVVQEVTFYGEPYMFPVADKSGLKLELNLCFMPLFPFFPIDGFFASDKRDVRTPMRFANQIASILREMIEDMAIVSSELSTAMNGHPPIGVDSYVSVRLHNMFSTYNAFCCELMSIFYCL